MNFDAWKVNGKWAPVYKKLREEFRLSKFNSNESMISANFIDRNLIIGQEFFGRWLDKAKKGEAALVSGFAPSGTPHLGTLCVFKQMAYYQKNYNAKLFIPIADLEAIYVRHTAFKDVKANTINLLAHLAASGISLKKSNIYLQSNNLHTLEKTFMLANNLSISEFNSMYGRHKNLGHMLSALLMVSDILFPLNKGYDAVLVPIGIDEIKHIKLTRKLAKRLGIDTFPSATYADLIPGLFNSKMSKSVSENSIALSENPEIAERRVRLAISKNTVGLYYALTRWFSSDNEDNLFGTKSEQGGKIVRKILEKQNENYIAAIKDAQYIARALFSGKKNV